LEDEYLKAVNNKITVLFIDRKEKQNDWGSQRSSRIILNLEEVNATLTRSLEEWQNSENNKEKIQVQLMIVDLATLSYIEQLRLIASTSIIVGIHGAGITHLMHMSIGTKFCCGVIEIFPKGVFTKIRGHGTMARKMGLRFSRIDVDEADSKAEGTNIPVNPLSHGLTYMVNAIASSASASSSSSSSSLDSKKKKKKKKEEMEMEASSYNPHCVLKDVAMNPFLEH
jgi:hypothetical protein